MGPPARSHRGIRCRHHEEVGVLFDAAVGKARKGMGAAAHLIARKVVELAAHKRQRLITAGKEGRHRLSSRNMVGVVREGAWLLRVHAHKTKLGIFCCSFEQLCCCIHQQIFRGGAVHTLC